MLQVQNTCDTYLGGGLSPVHTGEYSRRFRPVAEFGDSRRKRRLRQCGQGFSLGGI